MKENKTEFVLEITIGNKTIMGSTYCGTEVIHQNIHEILNKKLTFFIMSSTFFDGMEVIFTESMVSRAESIKIYERQK